MTGGLKPSAFYPLERASRFFPGRLVVGPDARVSYGEMLGRVRRLAGGLARLGVGRGDFIGVIDFNTVRFMELAYAAALLNAVIVPVNYRLPPSLVAEILGEARPRLVLYSEPFKGLAELAGQARLVGLESYEDLLSGEPYEGEADPDADYVLLYTSGTTGKPKGVLYPQWKMVLGGLSIAWQLTAYETPARLSPGDVMLSLIPMFHILSWGSIFIAPYIGAKLVFIEKFDPALFTRAVREEGVTWFNAVPTMLYMLLEAGAPLKGLKALVGGSPVPEKLWRRLREEGLRVSMIYGATDMLAASISIITDSTGEDELRTTTHPVPFAELRVVRPDGSPAGPGELGEILYRSPWMPSGYYKRPEKTKEAFAGGWFRTGDIGVLAPDGGVRVLDRVKDAVKSGGEWIPTSILESIIAEVEGVRMAAVVPVEHEKWGERPVAVYTGTADPDEVKRHLEEAVREGRIAKWWIPDRILRVDELPLTSTGKINKLSIREMVKRILRGGG